MALFVEAVSTRSILIFGHVDSHTPTAVSELLEPDFNCIVRKDFLNVLRPFEKADSPGFHIVVGSDLESFLVVFETVAVEMIDELGGCVGSVFVDDGERRRGCLVGVDSESRQRALMNVVFPTPISP